MDSSSLQSWRPDSRDPSSASEKFVLDELKLSVQFEPFRNTVVEVA